MEKSFTPSLIQKIIIIPLIKSYSHREKKFIDFLCYYYIIY